MLTIAAGIVLGFLIIQRLVAWQNAPDPAVEAYRARLREADEDAARAADRARQADEDAARAVRVANHATTLALIAAAEEADRTAWARGQKYQNEKAEEARRLRATPPPIPPHRRGKQ